mgnify:CR=1 FL=1
MVTDSEEEVRCLKTCKFQLKVMKLKNTVVTAVKFTINITQRIKLFLCYCSHSKSIGKIYIFIKLNAVIKVHHPMYKMMKTSSYNTCAKMKTAW